MGVGLAAMPDIEQPRAGGGLAGTSTNRSPASSSRCARGRPTPLALSTAHTRSGHALADMRIAA